MATNKDLTEEKRKSIVSFLINKSMNGVLPRNVVKEASEQFSSSKMTIYRLWKKVKNNVNDGTWCVASNRKGKCGRKKKDWTEQLEMLKDVPLPQKATFRSLSNAIKIPKSTLFRICKERDFVEIFSSRMKPNLTEEDKVTQG